MAFKFTKEDEKRLGELREQIEHARGIFEAEVNKQNDVIEEAHSAINAAAASYNELAEEIRRVVEDIASEQRSEYDDMSENWQDGERGQTTAEWIDVLDSFNYEAEDMSEVAFEPFDYSAAPDIAEMIENLPRKPEY